MQIIVLYLFAVMPLVPLVISHAREKIFLLHFYSLAVVARYMCARARGKN
jgi:hypothetical protein